MTFVYHERQLGGLCGVHCLNNLLQGPHFGPGDLAEIGVQLDQQEQALFAGAEVGNSSASDALPSGAAPPQEAYNVDMSADGGNFSIQVLTVALQKFGLQLLPAKHPDGRRLMQDPAMATEAFLCQYRDHWFAIRKVADCWWNLNSTRRRPAMVGPFYLAAWLAQLGAEGYSIFLVMGDSMPTPMKPRDPNHPEENFHELFDLLEKAKESGGNPLAGGGDEVDEADRRAAAELQAEEEAAHLAALQREFESEEDRRGGGGGLYEEMLQAQMEMQGGGRGGGGRWRSGGMGGLRSVSDDVRVDQGYYYDVSSQPAGPRESGGFFQELLQALKGCPCQYTPEETTQIVVPNQAPVESRLRPRPRPRPASQSNPNSPSSRAAAPRGRSGEDNSPQPMALQRQLSTGGPMPTEQSLREMGFKEPLVKLAEVLGSGRHGAAVFQLLLQHSTVDPSVFADGASLSRELNEAVLRCDTTSPVALTKHLVQLVALLSLEEAQLSAAQSGFSNTAMAEFVQQIMRQRVESWSAEMTLALTIVVDMLENFPDVQRAACFNS